MINGEKPKRERKHGKEDMAVAPKTPAPKKPTPRRMSKDLQKSKRQRQKIFRAVAKAMLGDSAGFITMDSIAARMGVSKAVIYYYFQSKGDLLYQMQIYCYDLLEEAVWPIIDDKALPARERFARAVHVLVMVFCEHWELWRVLWTDFALREVPKEQRKALKRRRSAWYGRWIELIGEASAAEGWAPVDAKVVTLMITGLAGSLPRWYRKRGPASAEQIADLAIKSALGFFEPAGAPDAERETMLAGAG